MTSPPELFLAHLRPRKVSGRKLKTLSNYAQKFCLEVTVKGAKADKS